MGLDGLYGIDCISEREDKYLVDVTLFSSHQIYHGHFPGKPVVPGVCTIYVIRECVSAILQKQIRWDYIKEAKFISALLPVHDLKICLEIKLQDGNQVRCSVSEKGNTVMKLSASYILEND